VAQPGDVFWCTADCGWVTGHTYLAYGPLLVGATQASPVILHAESAGRDRGIASIQRVTGEHWVQGLFGSTPTFPTVERVWEVIERYRVRIQASHDTCTQ
jgi:acyl-coenzyme A synthetase/AMP-(fatty) acid ligase